MELLVNTPIKNRLKYTRGVSDAGAIYFLPKSDIEILTEDNLDYIDIDLRVACAYISRKGCKVFNYNAVSGYDKKQVEKLYNAYKTDEKDMRKHGIFINHLDGSRKNIKIERYRFNYASYEQFAQEYPKDRLNQFLCFYMHNNELSNKILINMQVFADVDYEKENEKIYFGINYNVGDLQFSTPIWRNFTSNLVKTIENEMENL